MSRHAGSIPAASTLSLVAIWRRTTPKPLLRQGFTRFWRESSLSDDDIRCPSAPQKVQRICSAPGFRGAARAAGSGCRLGVGRFATALAWSLRPVCVYRIVMLTSECRASSLASGSEAPFRSSSAMWVPAGAQVWRTAPALSQEGQAISSTSCPGGKAQNSRSRNGSLAAIHQAG